MQKTKSFVTRCVEGLITEHDKVPAGFFHVPHIHKILGFTCLFHYFYRFYLATVYGTMFFDPDHLLTWITPALHLTLSLSSFIFPVPTRRFGSKPIIWKELQLHNIIFTTRSCLIFWLWAYRPCILATCGSEHFIFRMLIVIGTHYAADLITNAYQDLGRTTTRDMPWGADVPAWIPPLAKKFYAVCQLFATTALLCQGTQLLDGAFSIMYPIQISTFLMTLVRKSLLTGTQWHLLYALSLSLVFWMPIATLLRSFAGFEEPKLIPALQILRASTPSQPSLLVLCHLALAPMSAFLRMGLRMNKYLVIVTVSGCMLLLAQWAEGRLGSLWDSHPFAPRAGDVARAPSLEQSILGHSAMH